MTPHTPPLAAQLPAIGNRYARVRPPASLEVGCGGCEQSAFRIGGAACGSDLIVARHEGMAAVGIGEHFERATRRLAADAPLFAESSA